MSWHPSHASTEALDHAAPSRYRSAVVQCTAGQTMLVMTEDGDERLVPAPTTPPGSLVGSRVLLANDHDWVVAIDPADPEEAVVVDLTEVGSDARSPSRGTVRASRRRSALLSRLRLA